MEWTGRPVTFRNRSLGLLASNETHRLEHFSNPLKLIQIALLFPAVGKARHVLIRSGYGIYLDTLENRSRGRIVKVGKNSRVGIFLSLVARSYRGGCVGSAVGVVAAPEFFH